MVQGGGGRTRWWPLRDKVMGCVRGSQLPFWSGGLRGDPKAAAPKPWHGSGFPPIMVGAVGIPLLPRAPQFPHKGLSSYTAAAAVYTAGGRPASPATAAAPVPTAPEGRVRSSIAPM